MSMNEYMHPRNIYKHPPNFKQLAIEYSEFRKYVSQDFSGKVSIDFKNVEALRALTCTLLKKDFNIDLEIPLTKLIPTIPLRLNYILWIEDLLSLQNRADGVKGIDIGTGASCIYPLLGARKNQWSMVATEIDQDSAQYANNNVTKNSLNSLVKVYKVKCDALLEEVLTAFPGEYDFCMCNPPFFSSAQELHPFFKARKQNRPHPRNAFCATINEVVANGGEIEYVTKLINESKKFGSRIKVYTTMIGHKSSLPVLKKLLREAEVISFKQTEFCQGHTTRWGLAWTFLDIDLRKIPGSLVQTKQQLPKPLVYEIPKVDEESYKVKVIYEKLISIFKGLQIDFCEVKHVKNYVDFTIVAYSNTWSHQRRRRREKMRIAENNPELNCSDKNSSGSSEGRGDLIKTCDRLEGMDFDTNNHKRLLEENEDEFYNVKKLKATLPECDSANIHLKANVAIMKENTMALKLTFVEGKGAKEALHQVLQYIKNNLK